MRLPRQVEENLKRTLDDEKRYLIAFSGGPDSVYLLDALATFYGARLSDEIALCYIDYHDSPYVDLEEKIVAYYADRYHLKLFRSDTEHQDTDGNFEEWARNYRYRYFREVMREEGYDALLTAHQKDDDIETYVLQKERGNAPLHYGLKLITDMSGMTVIRPLLPISKRTMINTLKRENLPFYDDLTNRDDHTRRNIIRRNITYEEKVTLLREKRERNKKLAELYDEIDRQSSPYSFSFYDSLSEEGRHRFIFYLLSRENISSDKRPGIANEMFEFLKRHANGVLHMSNKRCLYRTRDLFYLHDDYNDISYSFEYDEAKEYDNPFFFIDLSDITRFNLDRLPVTIRNAREDDDIATDLPTKNVYEALRKQQVPSFLLPVYPVFSVDGEIRCVPFFKDLKEKKIPLRLKLF